MIYGFFSIIGIVNLAEKLRDPVRVSFAKIHLIPFLSSEYDLPNDRRTDNQIGTNDYQENTSCTKT